MGDRCPARRGEEGVLDSGLGLQRIKRAKQSGVRASDHQRGSGEASTTAYIQASASVRWVSVCACRRCVYGVRSGDRGDRRTARTLQTTKPFVLLSARPKGQSANRPWSNDCTHAPSARLVGGVRSGRKGGRDSKEGDTGDLGRDRDGGCGTAGRRAGGQADEEESGLERQRQDKASRRRIATADVMLHRGASVLLLSCVCGSRLGKALDARRELRRQPMQPRSAAHACAWVRLRIGELKTDTYVRRNRVSVSRPAGSQQASVSAAFVRGGTSSSRWCMGRVAAHDDGWLGG